MAQQHHQDLSQTFSYASAPANFSEKYLFDKEEIYKAVISYDGYEYGCADGSSIVKNDINHCVKRLSDGTTQTYQLVYERSDGTKYLLQREELSDGRVRVYDTKCRIRNYNELQKTYTDEEDKYYVMYERKADGSYKRYDISDEKEDENYSYTVYKTKLVESYTSPEKIRKLSEKHRLHLMPGF